jgi:hypothetical protein
MSDNQIAIVNNKDSWYVGICYACNSRSVIKSGKRFETREDALIYANKLNDKNYTHYGICEVTVF